MSLAASSSREPVSTAAAGLAPDLVPEPVGDRRPGARVADQAVGRWFAAEVLPMEPQLTRFLARSCRDRSEVEDLKQEVYARVYARARDARPLFSRAFVFSTARNLLIDLARRRRIVSIDYVAEVDDLHLLVDRIEPERSLLGKEELARLQGAIDRLPRRCREVIVLRKVWGMSQREVAARLGVTEDTVERQVLNGMRKLTLAMSN